jgi:hypothetical protein
MANQNKENGMGRNGRARRFAMVFFLFFFNFHSHSHSPWCFLFRSNPTNKRDCVRVIFFFPSWGLACFDETVFFSGLFFEGEGSTATAGLFFVHSQAFWETGLNVFV